MIIIAIINRRIRGNFGADGYVYGRDYGDSFTESILIFKVIKLSTLNMDSFISIVPK